MKKDKKKGFLQNLGWLPQPPKQKSPQIPLFLKASLLLIPLVTAVTWYYLTPPSTLPTPAPIIDTSDNNPPSTPTDETPDIIEVSNHPDIVRLDGSLKGEFVCMIVDHNEFIHLRARFHRDNIPERPVLRLAEGIWPDHGGILVGDDFEMYIYEIGNRVQFGFWWWGPNLENLKLVGSGTYVLEDLYYHVTLQDATIYEAFYDSLKQSMIYESRWGPQTIQFSITLFQHSQVYELVEKLE